MRDRDHVLPPCMEGSFIHLSEMGIIRFDQLVVILGDTFFSLFCLLLITSSVEPCLR